MTDQIICAALLAVVALNILVFALACRGAVLREKAKAAAENVVELRCYRKIDVRV